MPTRRTNRATDARRIVAAIRGPEYTAHLTDTDARALAVALTA